MSIERKETWRSRPKLAKARLKGIILKHGSHTDRSNGLCAMEVVAWAAGEPHSDRPSCACPVIAAMVRQLNDSIGDDELRTQLLRPVLLQLVGSAANRVITIKRGFIAADFAVRVAALISLEAAGLKDEAAKLRALAPIVDEETAGAAARAAAAAAAAADAAYAAANAARAAAAAATAANAARAAADAARAAAAAADAAYAAADAADAAANAARAQLFGLTVDCIKRMLEVQS